MSLTNPRSQPYARPAPHLRPARRKRLRAALRDTLVLLREFRSALLLFILTLLVGGGAWMALSNSVGEQVGYAESVYTVLKLVFFAADEPFPVEWYRDLFFFLMPVLGLAILGRGAAEFGVLLFNRQSRESQWEVAVASTLRNHIVICGLGHLGIRVVRELISLGEDNVAVLDNDPAAARAEECKSYNIPVITGDGSQVKTLLDAGVDKADAFIVCTNNDLLNLQIALTVREVNPGVRLIVRIFDDVMGRRLADQLGFDNVFSGSALAAPFFAGAGMGTDVTQTFYVEDEVMNMSRLRVRPNSALVGATVGDLERDVDLSVVLHQRDSEVDLHPNPEVTLAEGDLMVVFTNLAGLAELRELNRSSF